MQASSLPSTAADNRPTAVPRPDALPLRPGTFPNPARQQHAAQQGGAYPPQQQDYGAPAAPPPPPPDAAPAPPQRQPSGSSSSRHGSGRGERSAGDRAAPRGISRPHLTREKLPDASMGELDLYLARLWKLGCFDAAFHAHFY